MEPAQKTIQNGAENEHMKFYRSKLQQLKQNYAVLLESKYTEGQLLHAHKHGLWQLVAEARRISQLPEYKDDLPKQEAKFEEEWVQVLENLTGGAKVHEVKKTY